MQLPLLVHSTLRFQAHSFLQLYKTTLNKLSSLINLILELANSDAVVIKRARHVIGEIERTVKAADAMRNRDFVTVSFAKKKKKLFLPSSS